MVAIGTCTEVLGDRVFGFGHAFNNEGPVALPMGSGRINGIVANLTTSFKLGSLTQQRGQLTADQTVGVAGRTGKSPPMVPVEVKVSYPGGSRTRRTTSRRPSTRKFTPLICGVAFIGRPERRRATCRSTTRSITRSTWNSRTAGRSASRIRR